MSRIETLKANVEHLSERIELSERAAELAPTAALRQAEQRRAAEYRRARQWELEALARETEREAHAERVFAKMREAQAAGAELKYSEGPR